MNINKLSADKNLRIINPSSIAPVIAQSFAQDYIHVVPAIIAHAFLFRVAAMIYISYIAYAFQ
jgi:hypothetical protein